MTEPKQPHEGSDRDAENDTPAQETPMDRFKGLTRQLLGVPRDKLKAEQERYKKTKHHGRGAKRQHP
jgi:hypothetical protein